MSLEDRQRQTREILDSVSRDAQRGHEAHEDTDPPPIPSPWPAREGREGEGSPSASGPPAHVRRLGNWGKYIAGMVAGLVALYTVGRPIFDWFVTRPSATDLKDLRTYCAGIAASAAASAVAPPDAPAFAQRFTDMDKRITHEGKRWDAHDKWLRQQFQRRNAPPVCQFGPKAESRGNACTLEDLDTP